MSTKKIEELLQRESEQYSKISQIAEKSIQEERTLSDKLIEFEDSNPSFTNRLADVISSFGGSWKFILTFSVFMIFWMIANAYMLQHSFDPFPFILLNLILSTIAALQAPIIMMSQNRKEGKDRQRAINDYLINLKAEIEIRNLHRKLDVLMSEQMKTLFELQNAQIEIMEETRKLLKMEVRRSVESISSKSVNGEKLSDPQTK